MCRFREGYVSIFSSNKQIRVLPKMSKYSLKVKYTTPLPLLITLWMNDYNKCTHHFLNKVGQKKEKKAASEHTLLRYESRFCYSMANFWLKTFLKTYFIVAHYEKVFYQAAMLKANVGRTESDSCIYKYTWPTWQLKQRNSDYNKQRESVTSLSAQDAITPL